jgi:hypothetical protein
MTLMIGDISWLVNFQLYQSHAKFMPAVMRSPTLIVGASCSNWSLLKMAFQADAQNPFNFVNAVGNKLFFVNMSQIIP